MLHQISPKPFFRTMTDRHLQRLKKAIGSLNEVATEIGNVAQTASDSFWADTRYRILNRKANEILAGEIVSGTTVKECIANTASLLRYSGLYVFQNGHPLPYLLLAEVDHYFFDSITWLTTVCGDERALQGFSPATPFLLTDRSAKRVVDVRSLAIGNGSEDEMSGWRRYEQQECFTDVALRQHYLLEKNGYFELARICQAYGCDRILQLIRLKIFCDVLYYPKRPRLWHSSNTEASGQATRQAFRDLVDERLSRLGTISATTHRLVEKKINAEVVDRLAEPLAQVLACHGALTSRSRSSVLSGLIGKGQLPTVPEEFKKLDKQAGLVLEQVIDLLLGDQPDHARQHVIHGIDVADLDSENPVRKLMAASHISQQYGQFLQDSGMAERYEHIGKQEPSCPMPLDTLLPIGIRLRAANFAQFFADLEGTVLSLPEGLFEFIAPPDRKEEEIKAQQQIHAKIASQLKFRMVVEELVNLESESIRSGIEAWLTYWEQKFDFAGRGVDSIDEMLFPAFFFSDQRFDQLLRNEDENLTDGWRRIRQGLNKLPPLVIDRNWLEVRKILDLVFREFLAMNLRSMQTTPPEEVNPFSNAHNPFAKPTNFFSRRAMLVEESQAPFEVVTSPPGSATRYAMLVRDNEPYIRRLRQLQALPHEETANIRMYMESGPCFNTLRLPLYRQGELLFNSVDYRPQPVPGKKFLVTILMDFSGSMGEARVKNAKRVAVILAEGMKELFDVRFYLYYTAGAFYRLELIFDSQNSAVVGDQGLASITRNGLDSGVGWNPDAATLLAMQQLFAEDPGAKDGILIHLGDHEWCKSLSREGMNSGEEMEYAVQRIVSSGINYVVARVGTDADPFLEVDLPTQYIHFPEGRLSMTKIEELYGILANAVGAGVRMAVRTEKH